MRAIATIGMLVAILSPIRADNQPAAAELAEPLVVFENVGDFPDYLFYVCPGDLRDVRSAIRVPKTGSVAVSEIGASVAGKGIFLFAVPKKLIAKSNNPAKVEWFRGDFPGVLKSKPLVGLAAKGARDEISRVTVFRIAVEDELVVTKIEPAPAKFSAPQVEIERAILYGLISSADRRFWIVGGAVMGAAVVFACWLVLRILALRRR